MDVTVNINAPAIVEAINKLAEVFNAALTANQSQVIQTTDATLPVQNQITAQPQYETIAPMTPPVQPQVASTAPVNVPQPPQTAPVSQTVAPTAPVPAVDEAYRNRVCTAAAKLIDQGKMPDVLATLQSFGVAAVTQLSATQLPEFANRIVALGAVI